MKRNSRRRTLHTPKAQKPRVEQSTTNTACPCCGETPQTNIEMEVFRDETGEFGITVLAPETTFNTGPFSSFGAVQDALHALVDDAIRSNAMDGYCLGVRSIVLALAPSTDA